MKTKTKKSASNYSNIVKRMLFFFGLILTVAFTLNVSNIYAQGNNLQFNQVKLISSSQSVPTSKVWQVVSVQFSAATGGTQGGSSSLGYWGYPNSGYADYYCEKYILINSTSIPVYAGYSFYSGSGSTALSPPVFPIWLPAGTTLAAGTGVSYVNVIEYNLVP